MSVHDVSHRDHVPLTLPSGESVKSSISLRTYDDCPQAYVVHASARKVREVIGMFGNYHAEDFDIASEAINVHRFDKQIEAESGVHIPVLDMNRYVSSLRYGTMGTPDRDHWGIDYSRKAELEYMLSKNPDFIPLVVQCSEDDIALVSELFETEDYLKEVESSFAPFYVKVEDYFKDVEYYDKKYFNDPPGFMITPAELAMHCYDDGFERLSESVRAHERRLDDIEARFAKGEIDSAERLQENHKSNLTNRSNMDEVRNRLQQCFVLNELIAKGVEGVDVTGLHPGVLAHDLDKAVAESKTNKSADVSPVDLVSRYERLQALAQYARGHLRRGLHENVEGFFQKTDDLRCTLAAQIENNDEAYALAQKEFDNGQRAILDNDIAKRVSNVHEVDFRGAQND